LGVASYRELGPMCAVFFTACGQFVWTRAAKTPIVFASF